MVEKGKLNLAIQHRFGDISGGLYELFGLDQATMRIGFKYGFTDNFKKDFSNIKPLSVGVDLDTGGHLFQLVLSNSQQMFGQGLFTYSNGDWTTGNLFFGFNLIREFKIKYY